MAYAILTKEYEGSFGSKTSITLDLPNMTAGTLKISAFKEMILGADIPEPDLKIELLLGNKILESGKGGIMFKAKEYVTGLKVKISGDKKYLLKVQYPSARPILTKKISLAFFQRAFDEFWNNRTPQPLFFTSGKKDNQILLNFARDLAAIHGLKPIPLELGTIEVPFFGNNIYLKTVKSKSISFKIQAEAVPEITVKADFEDIYLEVNNAPNVTFEKPVFKIQFKLVAKNNTLFFTEPAVTLTGKISINNWCDDAGDGTIRSKVEKKIRENLEEVFDTPKIGRVIVPWLLGEPYIVKGLKCSGNNMLIDYVGPEQSPLVLPDVPNRTDVPVPGENLKKIDHIIVLMMENRSFDHMLGYLKKDAGREEVEGLTGNESNTYKGKAYKVNKLTDTQMDESPCHDFECVANQMRNNMGGFVANFAERFEKKDVNPGKVMGYYGKESVPVYDYLATQFAICDHWFCAHPGPTWCNRFITVSGRLNEDEFGQPERDNPELKTFTPLENRTIFDELTKFNIPWKYFEHGYSFIRLFTKYTFDTTNVLNAENPDTGFFACAKKGTLPAVTFLDPDYIDVPPGSDDHPPADISDGQHFIGKVVKALEESPKWDKTLLIITYDEHGGFFDHVLPSNDAPPVSGITQYGPRVPAFIVSPWVKKGAVAKELFDHTSILATICRRFLPPPSIEKFGERTKSANDAGLLLTESKSRGNSTKISNIPPSTRHSRAAVKPKSLIAEPESRDFHELLFFARVLLGYPPR